MKLTNDFQQTCKHWPTFKLDISNLTSVNIVRGMHLQFTQFLI